MEGAWPINSLRISGSTLASCRIVAKVCRSVFGAVISGNPIFAVSRYFGTAEVTDKFLGVPGTEVGSQPDGMSITQEREQMFGRRPIAADRWHRRTADMLMMVQPPLPQVGERDRLEAQRRRCAHLQLAVNLGGHLPGQIPVRPDLRPPPLSPSW